MTSHLYVTIDEGTDDLKAAWAAKYGTEHARLSLLQVRHALAFIKSKLPVKIECRKVHPIGQRRPSIEIHRIYQSHAVVLLHRQGEAQPVGRYEFGLRSYGVRP